jgi:hypothetical protein
MHFFDLLKDHILFVARTPYVEPILILIVLAFVDDLEHVLSRILFVAAFACAVPLEVVEEGAGVFTDRAEINCLAAFGKEEKAVELLEENS